MSVVLAAIGAGLFLMSREAGVADAPRGIRNHNPGNVRISDSDWLGKVQGADKSFETFSHPLYGIRVIAYLLKKYQRAYRDNTVAALINRWAPPVENNTNAYAAAVAAKLGVGLNESIRVEDYLPALVQSIIHHENGVQPYSATLIQQAVDLA